MLNSQEDGGIYSPSGNLFLKDFLQSEQKKEREVQSSLTEPYIKFNYFFIKIIFFYLFLKLSL